MAFPSSTPVSAGETGTITQYNNLRDDALYPSLQSFTYGETIAVNDALYLKASDGKVWKTDADYYDERIFSFIGFAKEVGNANDVKKVQTAGKVEGLSGLTAGSKYYLSNTAGGILATRGTFLKRIGVAVSATELIVNAPIDYEFAIPEPFVSASDDILNYASDGGYTFHGTSYTKVKEIRTIGSGEFRVKFTMYSSNQDHAVYGRIYRNGVAYGTARGTYATSGSPATFTEDLYFQKGDTIELWAYKGAWWGVVSAFRVYSNTELGYGVTFEAA